MKIIALFLFMVSSIFCQDWPINYGDSTANSDPVDYYYYFIGYNAIIPDARLGIICGKIFERSSIGFYIALRASQFVPEKEWYPDLSEVTARDVFHDRETDSRLAYVGFTGGPIFHIYSFLYTYLGIGIYSVEKLYSFYDPTEILGDHGSYTVPSKSSFQVSWNIGIILRFKNEWLFNIGYNNKPNTVDVGLSYSFNF